MINLDEIIINIVISVAISATISFFIARYFKLKVKPKIEEIYEHNRNYRIGNISQILELSDWNMEIIFDILEQNNLVDDKFRLVNFDEDVLEKIGECEFRLKNAYDDMYFRIGEAKQYVYGDELLHFLDFINLSQVFAEELHNGKYNPRYLKLRGKYAKKLIKNYKLFFTDEFIKKWEAIPDYKLE